MSRLMSVALTEEQVRARTKTVTRRLGWKFLRPGTQLTLVRKAMGLKRGESPVRIAEVEVVSVRRELLRDIAPGDTAREGFPNMTGGEFIDFFCEHMKCKPWAVVTRIEWRYLP